MKQYIWLIVGLLPTTLMAQETPLPFANIETVPTEYTAHTVALRMVQGLGHRYYWATEGLRADDLEYRISEDSRSTYETLRHLYDLSTMVRCGTQNVPIEGQDSEGWTLEQLREGTLGNLQAAAEALSADPTALDERNLIWERSGSRSTLPFFNLINGPLADAIYHTGQVVAYRRASGNPKPEGVSVLRGTGVE